MLIDWSDNRCRKSIKNQNFPPELMHPEHQFKQMLSATSRQTYFCVSCSIISWNSYHGRYSKARLCIPQIKISHHLSEISWKCLTIIFWCALADKLVLGTPNWWSTSTEFGGKFWFLMDFRHRLSDQSMSIRQKYIYNMFRLTTRSYLSYDTPR
jgi:hypothetical protein